MIELVRVFEGHNVRIFDQYGGIWFIARDICDYLGYVNSSKVLKDNVDPEDLSDIPVGYSSSNGVIQNRKTLIINESGLYSLILRSNKPEAYRFKKWVTSEVLPSIRKTGKYEVPQELREQSKKVRNDFTFQLREHGCKVPIEFIKITATMKTHAGIKGNKKKDELDKIESGRIAAAEMIATVNLMIEDAKNYDECKPICRAASVSALIATGGKVEELESGNE